MSTRRLVALFDGTWNKPESNTNVERLCRLIAPRDAAGVEQLVNYIPGVGVAPGMAHLLGGAFGYGLSGNVKDGYRWLCEQWQPGDEIWLFGFSRGAYTARSLGGLIRKCGLLRRDGNGAITDAAVTAAYAFYRDTAIKPGDDDATAWRAAHSVETDIHFVGVWDTVGSLGIPHTAAWFPYARARYQFHDTDISYIVKHAYQALALDEHRADFAPAKWVRNPAMLAPGESPTAKKPEQIEVEQRWFVGAHADVGGGNDHDGAGRSPDPLPDLPLAWLQRKAMAAGLACTTLVAPAADAALGIPRDSYGEFMGGIYKLFKPRFGRVIGNGINETVDESVWRHARLTTYRSLTLARAMRDDVIAAPPGVA
ncbi:DUF2235 domain-containing protein [Rhodanobacter sp. DHG33]|uniref:DUF2235 domain-containing protein n=1 Tax=Rhodanobacter sp. DHG33 TaxID=2775921 RepID=UPI0017856309|nr:DUF2235 domain-containing protein [Rhodanobacter sp. DHG33]MBD8899235.1 DUF2235 domain-containing protein [Rhodanobacter sp. DHG33]